MSRTLQFRRYNSATLANTTGANGELIINSTTKTLTVHDGLRSGGYALASANDVVFSTDSYARTTANAATSLAQSAYNYANTIVSDTQIDQVARNKANSAFDAANTKFSSSGGTVSGSVTIQGNLDVTGNTIVTKAVEANTIIVDTTLYSGLASRSSVVLPHLIAQFASNSNTYTQVNTQNIDPQGSADFIVTADNGSDTDYYIDMGMLGSQYNNQYPINSLGTAGTPYDGYLYVQGSTINQVGGNLILGTTSTSVGQDIKFIVGGSNTEHVIVRMDHNGLIVNGDLTVSGQTHAKVPGPYANDSAAASAGITVGQMYYQASGVVHVRLT